MTSSNNTSGTATANPMPTSRFLNDPEEAARLLQGVSQAAHDAAEVDHAADVLLGISKPEPGTSSRGSTRSPSPQHFSDAPTPNNQGTKRRRRREPSVLSDHSTNTPTRGIDTTPATGLSVFNPWDPQTHETIVEHIRRGRYITGLPLEVDPKTTSKGKHQKYVEISIATLRQKGYEIETKTLSWLRANPLVEKGGPEGKQTWETAVKAEQHFRELFPDEVIKERKEKEEQEGQEGKQWKGKGKEKMEVKPELEGDEVEEEEEEDDEDEEVGAPGPSQAKRRRVDLSIALPAAAAPKKRATSTAPRGKGKGKEAASKAAAAADGRSRSPETPYLTPPFSPNKPPQQPGPSSFTPVNRPPLLPQEPVEDLAARLLDLAGAPKRRTAKRVTFAAAGSIDEVLATGSKEGERGGEGEKVEVKATTTTKGRVVQKPKKFGE